MTDLFDGYILYGSRTSQVNAPSSSPADVGISRDVRPLSADYTITGQPSLVDARGDQYRTAIVHTSPEGDEEYLLWAANSSSLALVEDSSWATTEGTGSVPVGTLSVNGSPIRTDGSPYVIVNDNGSRTLAGVVSITIQRGGSSTLYILTVAAGDISCADPSSGVVTLQPTLQTLLATSPVDPTKPALSQDRGDVVVSVNYWVAASRFWWTRNDPYQTRFGWRGASQRWEPYRGGPVKNLGVLLTGVVSTLSPRPRVSIRSYLPGGTVPDSYAMLRLGSDPGLGSYAIGDDPMGSYRGVLVLSDVDAPLYTFSGSPAPAAVVGSTSGKVYWNPAFVRTHAGQVIWYNPQDYEASSDGVVGLLKDAGDMYLAPVPGPTDRPILRLGNRRPLTVRVFETEADMGAYTPGSGEAGVAVTTGRIKLSASDITKADPGTSTAPNSAFNPLYLGAVVRYDGVSLNQFAQPLRAPAALVNNAGAPVTSYVPGNPCYIPDGSDQPALGHSGITQVPDKTGAVPSLFSTPAPRPGSSGLVRTLPIGESLVFTKLGVIEKTTTVNFNDELSTDYNLPVSGEVVVSLEKSTHGSLVRFSQADQGELLLGQALYFLQTDLCPSLYMPQARMYSRVRNTFTFTGTEMFHFSMDGISYTWNSSSLSPTGGTFTSTQVAASIQSILGSNHYCRAVAGRVVLEVKLLTTGSINIGFGASSTRDLSGCIALGFLPGWMVKSPGTGDKSGSDLNWLPDSGLAFILSRSALNLDRQGTTPDYQATQSLVDQILTSSVSPNIYQFLTNPPLEDLPGYGPGVFFKLMAPSKPGDALGSRLLQPMTDVQYIFQEGKFAWLGGITFSEQVTTPTVAMNLGNPGVIPESLYTAVGGYLKVAPQGGAYQTLDQDVDFVFRDDTNTGSVFLIKRYGERALYGSQGTFTAHAGAFTDTSVNFTTSGIQPGYRLKITSVNGTGYYEVTNVLSANLIMVYPPFRVGNGSYKATWEIYKGWDANTIDPTLLADVTVNPLYYLQDESFIIRTLTLLGTLPGTLASPSIARGLLSGRTFTVRFDQTGSDIPVTVLTSTILGVIANGSLFVPPGLHSFYQGFAIRVGTQEFVHGPNLQRVSMFSPDPGGGNGIEYLNSTSEMKFGSNLFKTLGSSEVTYVERPLSSVVIPPGHAQLDPLTSVLALSSTDISVHSTSKVYFVEKLIKDKDVALSPLNGCFTFRKPLATGQLVETEYYRAVPDTGAQYKNASGTVLVKEFLPVFIRREICTRITSQNFSFNPANRTLDTTVDPVVFSGGELLTYGVPPGATVNFGLQRVATTSAVPVGTDVLISYGVFEALGGETSYTVSQPPVWRPPLQVSVGGPLILQGDRTADLTIGKVVQIGPSVFYVKSSSYHLTGDITQVVLYPTPTVQAGSASPANDLDTFLSDRPVTQVVDGIFTGAPAGFLPRMYAAYGVSTDPVYDPIQKGDVEVRFHGDVRAYLNKDHLFEVGGYPFIITGDADYTSDGKFTTAKFTPPSPKSFTYGPGVAKVSIRPLYKAGEYAIKGLGPVVPNQPFELVLWGETDSLGVLPGRILLPSIDYDLNTETGGVGLRAPRQEGFGPNQRLTLSHTRTGVLGPYMYQGTINYPRYTTKALYLDSPSYENGIQGTILKGTYTFDAPDSFYTRIQLLTDFLVDFNQQIAQRSVSSNPSSGAVPPAPSKNSDFGRVGSGSQKLDLLNQDRAVRCYLSWFNDTITAFEQIEEAIDGQIIGDWDGKFRFQVGHNSQWDQPGYEDDLLGILNPRNIWVDTFSAARTTPLRVTTDDPIVDPILASVDAKGRITGPSLDPAQFQYYQKLQETLITNDVDDIVLVAKKDATVSLVSVIAFRVTCKGDFRRTGTPNQFSRIFPERTEVFTTLNTGVQANEATNDPGAYTFGRLVGFSFQSTYQKPIGKLTNPVLGTVTNISGLVAQERKARARVWGFSATGYPTLDVSTTGKPTIIATPLYLEDFPISQTTGLPDLTKLISYGSITGLMDLSTGDMNLHTPPFKVGDQLAYGVPTGENWELGSPTVMFLAGTTPRYSGIFVESVLHGCLVTLKDCAGTSLPSALDILAGTSTSSSVLTPSYGGTLFVIPTGGLSQVSPTPWDYNQFIQSIVRNLPGYRVGFDFNYSSRTGDIIDVTLPSFFDPTLFGVKELLGQNPPKPGSDFEGVADFSNGSTRPAQIPALFGGRTNDSGDHTLPYLTAPNTELDRLGVLADALTAISFPDSPTPPHMGYSIEAVYPDEILCEDGAISSTGTFPGKLITSRDLHPRTTSGLYPVPGHAGIGDLEPYDLLFVEPGTGTPTLPNGTMGILSAATVAFGTPSVVEVPRFVSPGNTKTYYSLVNAIGWVDSPAHTAGIVVTEDKVVSPGFYVTTFDIISVNGSNLVFDNDAGGGGVWPPIGGFNDFFTNVNKDAYLRIKLYTWVGGVRVPGAEVLLVKTGGGGTILGCVFQVSWDGGATFNPTVLGGVYFTKDKLIITTVVGSPGFIFTSFDPIIPAPGITRTDGYHDFNGDVVCTPSGGSQTAAILNDRLSFTEVYDLRTAKPRGTAHPISGLSLSARLSITNCVTSLYDVDAGADVLVRLLVNSDATTNSGTPFTFLNNPHTLSCPWGVGTFSSGTGTIRVPAFEGHSNIPVQTTGMKFSAAPSSRQNETSPILKGIALMDEIFGAGKPRIDRDNRLLQIVAMIGEGTIANVLPGDIVNVTPTSSARPNTKVGTYLVRVAQKAPGTVATPTVMGSTSKWLPVVFPKVVSAVGGALTTDVMQIIPATRDSLGGMSTSAPSFDATGRVFLILNPGALESTDPNVYKTAVYSADYTGYAAGVFTGLNNYRDGLGLASITQAQFNAAAIVGCLVSGMTNLRVQFTDKGVPGHCVPGTTVFGFTDIRLTRQATSGLLSIQYSVAGGTIQGFTGGGASLVVYEGVPYSPTTFSTYDVAYWGTPTALLLANVNFDTIHDFNTLIPGGAVGATRCLIPGDTFVPLTNVGNPGFQLEVGVFLEPSFPTPVNDLNSLSVNVVDAGHNLTAVGARPLATNVTAIIPANHSLQERVAFEVRRPRRFHDITLSFSLAAQRLRYVYEIRRGIVDSYVTSGGYGTVVARGVDNNPLPVAIPFLGHATQLGDFTDSWVNVHPGDIFRVLDFSGNAVSEAPIASVVNSTTLSIAPPGLTVSAGARFEIWLKKVIVPEEQSCQQLLELATDTTLVTRTANLATVQGGQVLTRNELTDTGVSFAQVQVGDILLVDPAGDLRGPSGPAIHPERGCRPFGDDGIVTRPLVYTAGSPDRLDDNRGYYTVTDTATTHVLKVTASGELAGNITTGDKILGSAYVIYPTVHASGLTGGIEGQMDLRITGLAGESTSDPNSYLGTYKSVGPFSYRVFRPSAFLSKRAVELILSTRERLLSWMEDLRGVFMYPKGGTYYIFQRDQHISNLGSVADPTLGLGVPSEAYLRDIKGRVEVSPFISSNDCVSILDRRFWCMDMRLDTLVPPSPPLAPPYATFSIGTGRPVLPDRIDDVLDQRDHLRQSRYAWLMLRVDRVNGTLTKVDNFDQQIQDTEKDQGYLLRVTRDGSK